MKPRARLKRIVITFCVLEAILLAPCYFLSANISGSTSEGILLKSLVQMAFQGVAMIVALMWGDRLFEIARDWPNRPFKPYRSRSN